MLLAAASLLSACALQAPRSLPSVRAAQINDRRASTVHAAAPSTEAATTTDSAAVLELFQQQKAIAEQKRERFERYQRRMDALFTPIFALQNLTGWVARLEPHDIDVITVIDATPHRPQCVA
eukprot:2941162-Prymnesium_polylepis.1